MDHQPATPISSNPRPHAEQSVDTDLDAWFSPVAKEKGQPDHRANTLRQLSLSTCCDLRVGMHLDQSSPTRPITQRKEGCLSPLTRL